MVFRAPNCLCMNCPAWLGKQFGRYEYEVGALKGGARYDNERLWSSILPQAAAMGSEVSRDGSESGNLVMKGGLCRQPVIGWLPMEALAQSRDTGRAFWGLTWAHAAFVQHSARKEKRDGKDENERRGNLELDLLGSATRSSTTEPTCDQIRETRGRQVQVCVLLPSRTCSLLFSTDVWSFLIVFQSRDAGVTT